MISGNFVFQAAPIRLPGGDHKPIQYGRGVRPAAGDNVVGVAAPDVVPRLGDGVAVGVDIVAVNVAAEDGEVGLPVALAAVRLRPGKAAVEGDAVLEGEGGLTVAGRAGVMHARLHPDLVAANGVGQRGLQRAGIGPTGAVAAALRSGRSVEHAGVGAHARKGREQSPQDE